MCCEYRRKRSRVPLVFGRYSSTLPQQNPLEQEDDFEAHRVEIQAELDECRTRIEAVDADRIATLINHFQAYADYPIVALLPEDAAALDEGYQCITNI